MYNFIIKEYITGSIALHYCAFTNLILTNKCKLILKYSVFISESLGTVDNSQLKSAVNEVEGMLTSLIDSVENSRASSAQSIRRSPKDSSVVMGSCKYV